MGRATGDRSLWDKAEALLAGWYETLPADGNLRMRPYDWEKLVCGLVDLHHYAGIDRCAAHSRADHRMGRRDLRSHPAPLRQFRFLGRGPGPTQEWYTLPENLYRAYLATGERRARSSRDVWLYDDYWRPLERREPNCPKSSLSMPIATPTPSAAPRWRTR